MPFIERIETNLPIFTTTPAQRRDVVNIEDPRAIESSQELTDNSDAVVISDSIDLRASDTTQLVAAQLDTAQLDSTQLTQTELEQLLDSISSQQIDTAFLDLPPLDSYRIMDRIHRLPLYGTFEIDVYI